MQMDHQSEWDVFVNYLVFNCCLAHFLIVIFVDFYVSFMGVINVMFLLVSGILCRCVISMHTINNEYL